MWTDHLLPSFKWNGKGRMFWYGINNSSSRLKKIILKEDKKYKRIYAHNVQKGA